MIYHTAPQHFYSPAGTLFIEFFSLYGLCWAGHTLNASSRKLLTMTIIRWFCRRIPAFAESVIEPVSSGFGTFLNNTPKPLRYHFDDRVVVFR